MKNLLITGAGPKSFVGRNLKEQLADDYNVFAPSHAQLELLDFDALYSYVKANRIELIVHGAIHVPMFDGAENEFYNDMRMFLNIEKISHEVEKVVYFGSGAEYDKRYDILNAKETDIGNTIPTSEYGLAKYTMNMIARRSENIYNLRLFGIFGKYELWDIKFLSNLCCKALFNLPLTIRKECKFDFLYIDDLPAAIRGVLDGNPHYHDYNVCSGNAVPLTALADIVLKASGKSLPVTLLERGNNLDYAGNNDRIRNDFPEWKITPIETAIKKLYKYYESISGSIDYERLKQSR